MNRWFGNLKSISYQLCELRNLNLVHPWIRFYLERHFRCFTFIKFIRVGLSAKRSPHIIINTCQIIVMVGIFYIITIFAITTWLAIVSMGFGISGQTLSHWPKCCWCCQIEHNNHRFRPFNRAEITRSTSIPIDDRMCLHWPLFVLPQIVSDTPENASLGLVTGSYKYACSWQLQISLNRRFIFLCTSSRAQQTNNHQNGQTGELVLLIIWS